MFPDRMVGLVGSIVVASAFSSRVEAATIDHDPVGCVVAEEFSRITARVTPPESVGRARVFFQPRGGRHWYAVAMAREGALLTAVLPKPKQTLESFLYYIEVADTALATSRTAEHMARVAARNACGEGMMAAVGGVAAVVLEVPAGAPAVPVGFSATGLSTAAPAASATGAASGGGGIGTGTAVIAGTGIVAAGAGAALALGAVGPPEKLVEIRGRVFATYVPNPANGNDPNQFRTPVAGAVVSTSLDSATTSTDAAGAFHLVTRTRRPECLSSYTITIAAAGHPTYSVTGGWGTSADGEQFFSLSPPNPAFLNPYPCP